MNRITIYGKAPAIRGIWGRFLHHHPFAPGVNPSDDHWDVMRIVDK